MSMMFMITTPPTTSDSETTPIRIEKMPLLKLLQKLRSASDVTKPKLSSSRGRR